MRVKRKQELKEYEREEKEKFKNKMRWCRRKTGENVIFIECLCDKPCSRGSHKRHFVQSFYQVAYLRKWNLKSSVRKPGTGSGKRAGLKWDLGIHPRFHSHQLCDFCSSHLITFFACKTCIISAQVIVRIKPRIPGKWPAQLLASESAQWLLRASVQFSSIQSLSHVPLFATPWTAAR